MGYDAAWERASREQLRREPWCRMCGKAATVADHIVSFRGRPELRLRRSNLRSLCKRCHDEKTARVEGGFGR